MYVVLLLYLLNVFGISPKKPTDALLLLSVT